MADFLSTLRHEPLLCDGATGSYLFELTGRLSEPNHVYEALNADQPEWIERIHLAYLAAGARCLKTNTFGANSLALRSYGLDYRLNELNRAAVRVARAAMSRFSDQRTGPWPLFLLASVGPTSQVLTSTTEVESCYRPQLESLIEAGVDALLLETFTDTSQLCLLIDLIHTLPGSPPIIAEITLSSTGQTAATPQYMEFMDKMHSLGVPVAGVNCCAPWDASAFLDAVSHHTAVQSGQLLLSVMPNAGGFQRIGNRFMTLVNPEFAGRMARVFSDRGVRLIGGCCEMHPPHIREMRNFLHARHAELPAINISNPVLKPPVDDQIKTQNGPFSRKLKQHHFVVSIEMLPPRGTDPKTLSGKIEVIRQLTASGLVDAVDLTDGSRGIALIPPGDFIHVIRQHLNWTVSTGDGVELIPHFTGRDLNAIGIQSRLIGYHANRIHNILFITGDPPKTAPTYPHATGVFDLDSVAMIRLTHEHLNAGVDFGGVPLGKQPDPRTHFTIGTGFEPHALDLKRELDRLKQKLDHGADYVMTQPVFQYQSMCVLEPYRAQCPILVGVMVLTGLDHALRMAQVPGVVVPSTVMDRLSRFESPADQAIAGAELAVEQVVWVKREGWSGVYIMSTASPLTALQVLAAATV